jgi:hypothetical protein
MPTRSLRSTLERPSHFKARSNRKIWTGRPPCETGPINQNLLRLSLLALLVLSPIGHAFASEGDTSGTPPTLIKEEPKTVTVRPRVIDDILVNPGIGFMTFQRFNGDGLNPGLLWTEGHPVDDKKLKAALDPSAYPDTSIAYVRFYWKFIEPEHQTFDWSLIDHAVESAKAHHQTLMLRVMPYGDGADEDVPSWYRGLAAERPASRKLPDDKWRVDPENAAYAKYFGEMIRALGARYDGNVDIESIDAAVVGFWGEGEGSDLLSKRTQNALVDAYTSSFKKSPLVIQPWYPNLTRRFMKKAAVGWRADCLGDMGGFSPVWSHMHDLYPEGIIESGVADNWKRAPVTFEACWVIKYWKEHGWNVDEIIDQSLKWHISSFNAKSSPVPAELLPNIKRWLNKMGYRLALRKMTFPSVAHAGKEMIFTSWWENLGVAPCYRDFAVAFRFKNENGNQVILTKADIGKWLPGDSLLNSSIVVPQSLTPGQYSLSLAIVDRKSHEPQVKLASEGRDAEGWYPLGPISIKK